MPNALADAGREGFLAGEIDWDTATIKASLVRGYTPNLATHRFISDVTVTGTLVATTAALTTKTIAAGVADAADTTFGPVATGAACNHIIVYQSSAVAGGADVAATAQRLIAVIDTATNLPITPNGGELPLVWSNVAGTLIFKL